MSNPYFDLQNEVAARLAEHATLVNIPMITEEKGDIEKRIQSALNKAGLTKGANDKAGLAILIYTPKGRGTTGGAGASRSIISQYVTVRVALFVKPLINDGLSGHQLAPLGVHYDIQAQVVTWNRGPGQPPIELDIWDSEETNNEISYYNDFNVPFDLSL